MSKAKHLLQRKKLSKRHTLRYEFPRVYNMHLLNLQKTEKMPHNSRLKTDRQFLLKPDLHKTHQSLLVETKSK